MSEDKSCCGVCCRGLYSCHWGDPNKKKKQHGCCWFLALTLVSLLSLCWMYICLVTFNDRDDINCQAFKKLQWWVNWFVVLIIASAVIASYCILLLVFALFHVALGERLDFHWLHKIFLFFGFILIVCGIAGISARWQKEWPTVPLSLQATGPFLQFGAVGALTLLSVFVFQRFHETKKARSKFLIAVVFAGVSAAIFLCPLFIHSPCLIEWSELPEKPKLIGHRGAPMLAPENTLMSFNTSIACGVTAFETDVQLSKDRIPFLMHDDYPEFGLRTTNIKEVFPDKHYNYSGDLSSEELQSLNAGEWFVKTDPFHSVSQLSEEDKATARNQTIPFLLPFLHLAQQHNVSVIFDIYSSNQKNDTRDIVDSILRSGIDPSLILWLPPAEREYVRLTAPEFIQVYDNESEMEDKRGKHLNVNYSKLSAQKIRELRERNVSVNLWVVNERWLFSLLWCAGASSVTTNSCHLLKDMHRPDWVMGRSEYRKIWISVDAVSILIMTGLFFCQRRRREAEKDYSTLERERDVSLLTHCVA